MQNISDSGVFKDKSSLSGVHVYSCARHHLTYSYHNMPGLDQNIYWWDSQKYIPKVAYMLILKDVNPNY